MAKVTPEMIELMKRMRSEGFSYAKISAIIGLGRTTVQRSLKPEMAERERKHRRKYMHTRLANNPEYRERERERSRERANNLKCRCRDALTQSRNRANKYGHTACNATIEQLVKAFTGSCTICGIVESDCKVRLSMDHDHITGDFRGWLCRPHNTAIDVLAANIDAAQLYLKGK